MGRGRKTYIHWLLCITIVLMYEAVSAYPVYAIEMNEENNIEAIDDNVSISLDDKVVTLENTIDENNTVKKNQDSNSSEEDSIEEDEKEVDSKHVKEVKEIKVKEIDLGDYQSEMIVGEK